jgi:hypothetical protein
MKRGLRELAAASLAGALLVPAAMAQPAGTPGNADGNGGEGGKPAWAGGKPSWAGSNGAREAGRANAGRAQSQAQAQQEEQPARDNPAWVCKAERDAMGEEAFAEAFGENENDANAFGKCVSEEGRGGPSEEEETGVDPAAPARDNPAWVCKAEREAMGEEAFADAFGTNEGGANAFGQCVAEEAQARGGGEEEEFGESPEGDQGSSLSETSAVDAVLATVRLAF